MMKKQYREPSPTFAPGVTDELDEYGAFIRRLYDGRVFDRNGDEIFPEDDDDDE